MNRAEPRNDRRAPRGRRPRRRRARHRGRATDPDRRPGLLAFGSTGRAQPGGVLKDVAFDQHLDTQIPLTLPFRDEEGRAVRLADYFGNRPVMLVMGYKNCPLLCSQVLGELTRSLRPLEASVGKDFDILYVSIDPKETPEVAGARRSGSTSSATTGRGPSRAGTALVGEQESIQQLARAIGFKYEFSPRTGKFAHAAGFVLLTPAGPDLALLLRRRVPRA